ncbi:hypothetical protein [Prevotella aurantiaca]|uniref:TetR/AcrR family transcriptional regulator n=1 Tax=Prevotella aurantiaca TaxID=596085 RepID=UPI0028EBD167|nr:hypothetical protein [Prevotella aurantiaca]
MYKRRYLGRRTEKEIEQDVMRAIATIISEKGISSVTIKEVSNLSKTDVIVLERRFKNDEELIKAYTSQFDYFLNENIAINPNDYKNAEAFFMNLIEKFIDAIYKNKDMQSIMVWEMYENSSLTRKSARKREVTLKEFLPSFTKQINNEKISPRALFAVLTGGLYYVLLRGNRSTFCGLDFSTKSGRKLLAETIFKIVRQFINE